MSGIVCVQFLLLQHYTPKRSMLFRKVILVYSMNYRKRINTLCEQNSDFLNLSHVVRLIIAGLFKTSESWKMCALYAIADDGSIELVFSFPSCCSLSTVFRLISFVTLLERGSADIQAFNCGSQRSPLSHCCSYRVLSDHARFIIRCARTDTRCVQLLTRRLSWHAIIIR